MKLSEFIEVLEALDMPDAEVAIAGDSEGNSFRWFEDVATGYLDGEDLEEFCDAEWDWRDGGFESPEEWEQFKADNDKIVVLWP